MALSIAVAESHDKEVERRKNSSTVRVDIEKIRRGKRMFGSL